jgi:glycosyltransferase involved in cell wall biosynthesis
MTSSGRPMRALAYADVDLNSIDGSAIWLQSMVLVLARAGCDVTVQLKAKIRSTLLVEPLLALDSVRIIEPTDEALRRHDGRKVMTAAAAATTLRHLDADRSFDLIVIRGIRIARELAGRPEFRGRLWTYLTDLPQSADRLDLATREALVSIVESSRFMMCQTEDLRSFLEHVIPEAVGKTFVVPPVVPRPPVLGGRLPLDGRPIRLVYSGKFAPAWKTLEMTRLPTRLAERGVAAELHMIGDKVHNDPEDPTYREQMVAALETAPDVIWHGARSREDAMALAGTADIGLGWRDRVLDASLELSTKALEYGALGLPVVLNRTPMHERLLGDDYPLFAANEDDAVEAIVDASRDHSVLADAARRAEAAAAGHTVGAAANVVSAWLERAFPAALPSFSGERALRIGVASHDLKFFTRILDHLQALPNAEVRLDLWRSLGKQDVAASRRLVDWADVIICEWCGPNAVWYSEQRRPDQRLIIRLHRFELYRPWPAQVAIDNVQQIVCVSPSYASLATTFTGWPASKIETIPNYVDIAALDRPKLEGAEFNLGFIGLAPSRKRVDLALDVLEQLRRHDRRFTLFVKSKLTWQYSWIWSDPAERTHIDMVLRRIQTSDLLRDAVVFDDFGPDVGSWLRRIGFVLSTSDDESFHLAPAEGMASGAVPQLLDWPGADTIYDGHWIHSTPAAMADDILSIVHDGRWDEERRLARLQAEDFSLDRVVAAWGAIVGGVAPVEDAGLSTAGAGTADPATADHETASVGSTYSA